jgi:hypothetical protein
VVYISICVLCAFILGFNVNVVVVVVVADYNSVLITLIGRTSIPKLRYFVITSQLSTQALIVCVYCT